MPIFDHDGTAAHSTGKVYDHDGLAAHPVGKVYDHDGTAAREVYSAGLPPVLLDGATLAPQASPLTLSTAVYESAAWQWNNGNAAVTQEAAGVKALLYGVAGRKGGSLVTPSMDMSANAGFTVTGGKTANGYYNTGTGSAGPNLFLSAAIVDPGGTVLAFQRLQLPAGWNNFADQTLTLAIPAATGQATLWVSAFSTDNDGAEITIKRIVCL